MSRVAVDGVAADRAGQPPMAVGTRHRRNTPFLDRPQQYATPDGHRARRAASTWSITARPVPVLAPPDDLQRGNVPPTRSGRWRFGAGAGETAHADPFAPVTC